MNWRDTTFQEGDSLLFYLKQQEESFIKECMQKPISCIVAISKAQLDICAFEFGWTILPLEGTKESSALVVKKSESNIQLLVRSDYTGYRHAFYLYLKKYYGFESPKIPARWHVDHLVGRERFKMFPGDHFIRLILIEGIINSHFGGCYERVLNGREKKRRPSIGMHLDYGTILKVLGYRIPSKANRHPIKLSRWCWEVAGDLANRLEPDQYMHYFGVSLALNFCFYRIWEPLPLPIDLWEKATLSSFFRHCDCPSTEYDASEHEEK